MQSEQDAREIADAMRRAAELSREGYSVQKALADACGAGNGRLLDAVSYEVHHHVNRSRGAHEIYVRDIADKQGTLWTAAMLEDLASHL